MTCKSPERIGDRLSMLVGVEKEAEEDADVDPKNPSEGVARGVYGKCGLADKNDEVVFNDTGDQLLLEL